jgi:hypothetical protein
MTTRRQRPGRFRSGAPLGVAGHRRQGVTSAPLVAISRWMASHARIISSGGIRSTSRRGRSSIRRSKSVSVPMCVGNDGRPSQ